MQIKTLTNTINESKHEAEAYLQQLSSDWARRRPKHKAIQRGSKAATSQRTRKIEEGDGNRPASADHREPRRATEEKGTGEIREEGGKKQRQSSSSTVADLEEAWKSRKVSVFLCPLEI